MNFVSSWSGGKDSCYAVMRASQNGFIPKGLLNMMNENGKVSRSHGLPLSVLKQQAQKMQVAIESLFVQTLKVLKNIVFQDEKLR